ncbi:Folylpolyglutamate synthetase [Coemansia sp. BCRC 34301]|nr:Folylpolyglutamate synthetase [Coemansia sp. BCRC 34301]
MDTLDDDALYLSAVKDLNGLQTNHSILQQIKASGGRINEYSLPEFGAFVEKLGHQVSDLDTLNVIHVTGTKGKGSTCAFVQSLLSQKQLKIGLFTSPHLIEVRERIQINGSPLSRSAFAKYFYQTFNGLRAASPPLRRVTEASPSMPMYFRFLTLMAYHVFLAESVDVAIMEVGVGGEYDSTNIIERPTVCGIASLGIDHQAALGSTIEEIAWHKAGIIKRDVPVFTAQQPEEALQVIRSRAIERHAPPPTVVSPLPENVELGIAGDHQRTNAALAVALCREWMSRVIGSPEKETDDTWITRGLRQAKWPGRTQTFEAGSVCWHVDGAHTVESMSACAAWFSGIAKSGPCVLIFNAAHNRGARTLLETLARGTKECGFVDAVFCPNLSARPDSANFTVACDDGLAPQHDAAGVWAELAPNCKTTVLPTIDEAVAYVIAAYANHQPPTHVLATGSLHLVGGVIDAAKGCL